MTGWPAALMQDDSPELSRWLSNRLDARHVVRMNCKEMLMSKQCCNQNCNQGRSCPIGTQARYRGWLERKLSERFSEQEGEPAPRWVVAIITALCSVWVMAGIYLLTK